MNKLILATVCAALATSRPVFNSNKLLWCIVGSAVLLDMPTNCVTFIRNYVQGTTENYFVFIIEI